MSKITSVNYNTFNDMLISFLNIAVGSDRDSEIVLKFMGFGMVKKPTYAEIGRHYDLCRERIRQIIRNNLAELKTEEKI